MSHTSTLSITFWQPATLLFAFNRKKLRCLFYSTFTRFRTNRNALQWIFNFVFSCIQNACIWQFCIGSFRKSWFACYNSYFVGHRGECMCCWIRLALIRFMPHAGAFIRTRDDHAAGIKILTFARSR